MNNEKMTIKQIRAFMENGEITPEQILILRCDERTAVQNILRKWERAQQEIKRVQDLYHYEGEFYQQGLPLVAGVDEAGRGPLAGPLAVAAVILPVKLQLLKINDSKKLSAKVREELYQLILTEAIAVERVFIEPETIDRLNIYQATVQGMYQVVRALRPAAQAVLIDAIPLNDLTIPGQSLIKGDALSASIAAASIVAKVERDRKMVELEQIYPQYGFAQHKGYGTAQHLGAIRQYGPCPSHRKSFEPIKSWRK